MFNKELIPEELTVSKMGKIVQEMYPSLEEEEDIEAVRQRAVAAMNFVQQGKKALVDSDDSDSKNTSLIDGVRKFALSVKELDIDLIDRINPFGEAYAILSKTMDQKRLQEIHAIIGSKRTQFSLDEARDLAKRAMRFMNEHGRLPSIAAQDPWEKRMAEGVAYLAKEVSKDKVQ